MGFGIWDWNGNGIWDWNGIMTNGMEWNGMEWAGMGWNSKWMASIITNNLIQDAQVDYERSLKSMAASQQLTIIFQLKNKL